MLSKAIDLLNPEAWRKAVKHHERPSDGELEGISWDSDLLPAYEDRKRLWGATKAAVVKDLEPAQRDVVSEPFRLIDERFAECDEVIDSKEHPQLDHASARWFYAAQYPDMIVTFQFDVAREALSAIAKQTVDDIVAPLT